MPTKLQHQLLVSLFLGYPGKILTVLALTVLSGLARHVALSCSGPAISFIFFYPVVICSAWLGGLALGSLATLVSVVLLAVTFHSHTSTDVGMLGLILCSLAFEGLATSAIVDALLRRNTYPLEHRLARLQAFINDAPTAIAMLDRDMRYLAVSRRWLSDYSLERRHTIGRSHYEIFPEITQRWKEVNSRCLAGAVERSHEDEFIRSDGSRQWLVWEVRPWRIDGHKSKVGGIVIFSEDITAMKAAHAQESIMRASAKVDNARRAEAEALLEAKDQFVVTLSHELRTPLNALLGWIQLLKRAPHDSLRLQQALAAIQQSGMLLARLVSDILDINRIASGKLRLTITTCSVASLIDSAFETMLPAAEEKAISLKKDTAAAHLSIPGDVVRLQQCLWNLLSNAIKFTPRGGRITVSARRCDEKLHIVVSDTGQGIPADMVARIFERFIQVESSSPRGLGGLGIGLAIVKHLVELHGGTVRAESAGIGLGSTFTIVVPLVHELLAD